MSKIVFVLGAGASAHCGTPLMRDFLNVARDLMRAGKIDEVKEDFALVFEAVGKLHAVHSKAILDVNNIETAYTAFEMGRLLGRLPGIEDEAVIDKLTSSIKKVIGYTLQETTKLPNSNEGNAPRAYYQLAGIIQNLLNHKMDCSILTFNYDLGLEYALYKIGILPDYCLIEEKALQGNIISYLKLHGSLNWGKCDTCGGIVAYRQFQYTSHRPGDNYSTIPIMSDITNLSCKGCGTSVNKEPVIIPPTWNKTAHNNEIKPIWRKAAKALRDAEHIFVLGYSLPSTDWFFNYLFALGVDMATPVQEFCVVNTNDSVAEKFRRLLGPGITNFKHEKITFEEFVTKPNPLWKRDDPVKIRVWG